MADKDKTKKVGEEASKGLGKRVRPTKSVQTPSKKRLNLQDEAPAETSQEAPAQTSREDPKKIPVQFTARQEADFACFKTINIHPTRFITPQFLEKTGLKEDVRKIIEEMGLTKFSETMDFLYPELVREFFASVELIYKKPRIPKPDEGVLKFVCNGYAFSLTIAEVCEIYGFRYGSETKFGDFASADSFWNTIAKENANGNLHAKKNPKSSLIRNPAIRYIHRLLGNTFFARKQSGGVRRDELWLLFMGVRRYMVDEHCAMFSDVEVKDVNLGCVFAKELTKIRAWGRTTSEPDCFIGSMLTPIFCKIKIDLISCYQEPEQGKLNREYFVLTEFLEDTTDAREHRYVYTNRKHEKRSFPLPNTDLTSITSLANIYFEHTGEDLTVLVPKGKRGETEEPETDEPQAVRDPWELPELPFEPKTAREKIFYTSYKIQKMMNKMAKNKFNWLKAKLRKTPGYVSDEDEFIAQEEGQEMD